jgi:hypothetical protein
MVRVSLASGDERSVLGLGSGKEKEAMVLAIR